MPPIPELEDGHHQHRHHGRRNETDCDGDDNTDDVPNETTRLLLSSNNRSTNNNHQPSPPVVLIDDGSIPLTSSYGDLKDSLEVQLHGLHQEQQQQQYHDGGGKRNKRLPTKKYVYCILLLGIALLIGMTVLVMTSMGLIGQRNDTTSTKDDNNNRRHHHSKYQNQEQFDTGDGKPFSLLDPVMDLGLPAVTRSVDTSPDWSYLGNDLQLNHHHHQEQQEQQHLIPDNVSNGIGNKNQQRRPLPTNAWYQNLLLARGPAPTNLQRAYPSPYLVDVVGLIPGLRVHSSHVVANAMVMQLSFNEDFGLVVGATSDMTTAKNNNDDDDDADSDDNDNNEEEVKSHKYKILETTELGITLEWDVMNMTSNIVRGMSYVTMEYNKDSFLGDRTKNLPTIAAPLALKDPVMIDGSDNLLDCSEDGPQKALVQKDIELYFHDSDFSWMVFFSQPVWIQCYVIPDVTSDVIGVPDTRGKTFIQIVDVDESPCVGPSSDTLVVRAALIDQCTTGFNAVSCRKGLGNRDKDEPEKGTYTELLRRKSDTYPGRHTSFSFSISDDDEDHATLHFDWNSQRMSELCTQAPMLLGNRTEDGSSQAMLMFALPHHMERLPEYMLPGAKKRYCKSSIIGPACLVEGNTWNIRQDLPRIQFQAPRHPRPEFIPNLAKVLKEDMKWRLPDWVVRGSGDTYFSGKYLAKLARILLIAEELNELCSERGGREFLEFCLNSTLPTIDAFEDSVSELREGVQIWLSGNAEAPFLYDQTWGGVISCGCIDDEENHCRNKFPDCPGLFDGGLNFGNGFYNDHHFHYGYHIYAAAALAHFDPKWGVEYFEQVTMLVRDISNPSSDDSFFPLYRHKDWYQGSSWASGTIPYLNGRNQESSSEAIAAYEGVALYGQVMREIWIKDGQTHNAAVADEIARSGKLLAGTELTSAKRYWHVNRLGDPDRIYPRLYEADAVGILWNTMAQFGTWFGAAPYLPIGIQLLPLTPISEDRDEDWANLIYKPLTEYCAADFKCTESGWAILQLAILATVGYADEAAMRVKELPDDSFENAGGNGQSRTNTLWYISTRPVVVDPIPILRYDKRGREEIQPKPRYQLNDCYLPDTCTESVLDRIASEFTCRERMTFLIEDKKMTEWDACWRIGGLEFPDICGECNPGVHFVSKEEAEEGKKQAEEDKRSEIIAKSPLQCEPCSHEQCASDLNSCPVYKRTFVCTEGTSKFGCSGDPQFWVEEEQCDECCEMTHCVDLKDKEAQKVTHDGNALEKSNCPPCPPSVCYGKINQCPLHTAPYLCTKGLSWGGCASSPWSLHDGQCVECCEIKVEC